MLMPINTPWACALVAEWLESCRDRRVLTDEPNTCGLPNLPGFVDHRHDQSVLSLQAGRRNLELFRHPSQFGNHAKLPEYRERVSGQTPLTRVSRPGTRLTEPC